MPIRTMAVVPSNTAGTGGALTDVTAVNYAASNGYSSKYHLYAAGLDWMKPVGLLIHFHGDGAFEYNNPTSSWMLGGANGLIAQAKARNMILLVPLTPDDAVGRFTWWAWYGKEENPRYARDLIAYILGRYKIDKKRIWLSGYSGGSQFITRYLLPHFGVDLGIVGGGFICFAGGQAPAESFAPYNPSFKAAWHCRWVVGALDDGTGSGDGFNAIAASNVGAAWYSGQGFATEVTQLAGLGHDLNGLYGPHTGAQIDARPVPKTLAQVTALRYNGQTVKEARMMIGGVMRQVYPLFAAVGMLKSGSSTTASSGTLKQVTGMIADPTFSGSTVTLNALSVTQSKTDATIEMSVNCSNNFTTTVTVAAYKNGAPLGSPLTRTGGSGTFTVSGTATGTVAAGDLITLMVAAANGTTTINTADTYLRVT